MTQRILLTGADLILPDAIASKDSLLIEGDRIASIGGGSSDNKQTCTELRLPGKIILPGLIDVHSDAIEKLVEPRPKVYFPLSHAIQECDAKHLAAGITTVFNSIAFAGKEFGIRDPFIAEQIIRTLSVTPATLHRRLHLRYEVTDVSSAPVVESLLSEGKVDLISFMDHSPGQGQYARRGAYTRYLMRTYAMTEREARRLIAIKRDNLQQSAPAIQRLTKAAITAGVPIAGHDLDCTKNLAQWHQLGATISEFPINEEAARSSHKLGMAIVMGAPNVIRGTSSGNALRAIDVIRQNLVDILCSDYMPGCLLPALFRVSKELGIPLPDAIALATWKPAAAAGLADTGRLEQGCVADLLIVSPTIHGPQLEGVMVAGKWRYLTSDPASFSRYYHVTH